MTRKFVLVTATSVEQGAQGTACAGIRKLRRGTTLRNFVDEYLAALAPDEVLERHGGFVALRQTGTVVMSWTFSEYPASGLLRAVSHLTKDELMRDLNELLPLKETLG